MGESSCLFGAWSPLVNVSWRPGGTNALLEAAWTVSHSRRQTFFTARHRRIAARRGNKRAAIASAHSLLVAIYHMLRDGTVFQDLGPTHFEKLNREAVTRRSLRRLEQLGYRVTLEEATA